MKILPLILLLPWLGCVLGARILAVLPMPGKSHFIYCQSILSELAAKGHHVTVYSPFTPPKPVPNMNFIEVQTPFANDLKNSWTFQSFQQFVSSSSFFGFGANVVFKLSYPLCEQFLGHEKVKALIASKEKFDIVMTEALFGEESMLVFGHIFKAPVINLSAFGPFSVMNRVHGNDLQIASYPDCLSFPFTNTMSYIERLRNLISTVSTLFVYHNFHLPQHQTILKKHIRDPSMPLIEDMVYNISLTLANFHPAVGYPQPYPPSIVPVGGVHISKEVPPLPKDIKEFMDRGKKAVIYFSLGTVVPIHLMPETYIQTFVKVFSKVPYQVLWKTEADSIPNLPKNVMIVKWAPQQSILAHPNCILFITHGGLLSQHEVFNAGVPVVGIPFFGDQPFNVRLYEHLGVGVKLDFSTLTEDSMYQAIMSVAGKPKYAENAKRISKLFREWPGSPKDSIVTSVESVLRLGSDHLRSSAPLVSWYQIMLLDVLAGVALVIFIVFWVIKKACFAVLCKKKTVSSNKKKN